MGKVSCKTTIADDATSVDVTLSEDDVVRASFPVALADLTENVVREAACAGIVKWLVNAKAVSGLDGGMTGELAEKLIGMKYQAILSGDVRVARESGGGGLDQFGRILTAVYEKLGKSWDQDAIDAKYYERGEDGKLTTECRTRRNAASRNATFIKIKQSLEAKKAKSAANVAGDDEL